MATDDFGMGIPVPPDSTKIKDFPKVTRDGLNKVAQILSGDISEGVNAAAEAAVDQAIAGSPIVLETDPGIPQVTTVYGSALAVGGVDATGELIDGIRHDGKTMLRGLEIQGSGVLENYRTHPWIKGGVDAAGNLFEDALDHNGKVPQEILDAWSARMAGTAPTMHVFLVAGQSNAMNKSDWLDESVDLQDPWVQLWDDATKAWRPIRPDETWLGQQFGQAWVREHRGTKVGLVPAAVGDTGFKLDQPGGTWTQTDTTNPINLATRAVAMWNAAIAALTAAGTPHLKAGLLWSQGEADSRTMTQAQWAAAFDSFLGWLRTQLGLPKFPAVLGSLAPELFYEYEPPLPTGVNDAIRDTPRRMLYTSFVQGPNDYAKFNERVHYSVAGQRRRGPLFVEGVRRARLNYTLSKPITPPCLTVRRSGTEILISWQAPECRITAYALKVSTDSGATWTDQPLTAPLATSHTLTAAAGVPVWARVAATNDQGTSYYSIPYHG